MSKASTYWDKRRLNRYKEAEKIQKEYKKDIQNVYKRSLKNINEEIENVYRNYSTQTGLDKQKLKELLTKSETKKTFDELKKQGLDKYVMNNYKARINRLEQIQAQVYAKVKEEIYPDEKKLQESCFKDVINDGYYRTIYDIEQGTGVIQNFSTIDKNTMTAILNDNWSGKNYSKRIWGNTDMLAKNVKEIIGGAAMSGQSYAKTSRQIRERYNVARYYADRLARTETNYFNNQVDALASQELGFDEYVLVATLDMKTSEYCINIDHKKFKYSEMDVGVNYPPFHPNCRCTTRNYMGEYEKDLARTAINPVTGEREEVGNISYKEWYNNHGLAGNDEFNDIPPHDKPKLLKQLDDLSPTNIKKELESYEKVIKDDIIENAIVITKEGKIYRCFGDESDVWPDVDLGKELLGAYVTHNHPNISKNINTFTAQDRNLFYNNNLKVLRGTKGNYTFEMNRDSNFREPKNISINTIVDMDHQANINYSYNFGLGYKRWKNDE